MSVCLGKWEMGDGVGDGEGTPDWLVTISFGPKLIEKRVENCIGQQRGNVLGQPAKYSLGLIKHDQPQAADKGTNVCYGAGSRDGQVAQAQCCRGIGESKRESESELESCSVCWSRITQSNHSMQLVAWESDRISTVELPAVRNVVRATEIEDVRGVYVNGTT